MRTSHNAVVSWLVAAALLLLLPLRPVGGQFLGPEVQVNTYTANDQTGPDVAADDAGNFVVVWQRLGPNAMRARGSSGGGSTPPAIRRGPSFRSTAPLSPSRRGRRSPRPTPVTSSSSGTACEQDGSAYGVFGQRFDAAGSPAGSEFQVNTYTPSWQRAPVVAAGGNGNFAIVWASYGQDGSGHGIFGQCFTADGERVGSEFQVNTATANDQTYPAMAADVDGNFVVVWQAWVRTARDSGVFGRRFTSAGVPLGGEFQVNSYTTGDQKNISVAAGDSADFVVVWQSYGQDGSSEGVFGQRFDAAGAPLGGEFQVNSYTPSIQSYPSVAADSAGNFVVAWESPGDGSSFGVIARRFSAAGVPLENDFQVNTYTPDNQWAQVLAADGSGNFVAVWESAGQDSSGLGVFGRRLSNWVLLEGFEAGDVCAWTSAVGSSDLCP